MEDPRIERQKRHKLLDILVIAVCAVLCGAESFPAIEDFGHARYAWLKQFLEPPHGSPSHDTFNQVFRLLNPLQVQSCFLSWMQAVPTGSARITLLIALAARCTGCPASDWDVVDGLDTHPPLQISGRFGYSFGKTRI